MEKMGNAWRGYAKTATVRRVRRGGEQKDSLKKRKPKSSGRKGKRGGVVHLKDENWSGDSHIKKGTAGEAFEFNGRTAKATRKQERTASD